MILVLSLFTINMLLVVKVIGDTAVEAIREKIDINLFLKTTAEENEILALKAKVSGLSEVKDVVYISKAQALENFKNKHTDNPEVLEALKVLGNGWIYFVGDMLHIKYMEHLPDSLALRNLSDNRKYIVQSPGTTKPDKRIT